MGAILRIHMKNVQGSNVFSDVRASGAATWSAASLFAVILTFLVLSPATSHAATLWQSSSSSPDTAQVLVAGTPQKWFGVNDRPSIFLGTWDNPDFTTDASTMLHLWAQWNGGSSPVLDVILDATVNGDPFYGTGSTTANIVGPIGDFYRLNVWATSTLAEYAIPTNPGQTIHRGDQLWAYLYPSYGAYGANFSLGASGMTPFLSLCEDDCTTPAVPPPCVSQCNSNVLFLPGIESSRLYDTDNGETQLWEPEGDARSQNLALDGSGKSLRPDIYTRDVVDTGYGIYGMYDSFIQSMNALKSSGAISDWAAVPYDWRLSLDQILSSGAENGGNISYTTATDSPYIIQELKQLAATSKTGKVTIVAHSNGGLVAKALTQKLGADASKYIDKIIFVAVPQVGTPEAIGALLDGYDQEVTLGQSLDFLPGVEKISESEMRSLGDNSPSAYNLLPSASYFSIVTDPAVTFSTSTAPDWALRYGPAITSEDMLADFLTDQTHRPVPLPDDVHEPAILNVNLLAQSQAVHAALDAWVPPEGVQLIQIAGWGVPTTLSGIEYGKGTDGTTITENPEFTVDGDKVVVAPSALWTSTTAGATDYWVNLEAINNRDPLAKVIPQFAAALGKDHGNILTIPQLDSFISDIVTNSLQPLTAYQYITTTKPSYDPSDKRLEYALHSPLTLDLYDDQGRHTGISTTTGMIEEEIPGTYYTEFGGVKYIFAEENSSQTINMTGYANGTFTLNINELQGDSAIVASTTFADVPTTPQTTATVQIANDLSSISNLAVADGPSSISLTPALDGSVSPDATPIVTPVASSTDTPIENPIVYGGGTMNVPTSHATTAVSIAATSSRTQSEIARYTFLISFLSLVLQGITLVDGRKQFPYNSLTAVISAFLPH